MKTILIRIQTYLALRKIRKNGWIPTMTSTELMNLMRGNTCDCGSPLIDEEICLDCRK